MYSAFGNEECQGSTDSALSIGHVALESAAYASLTKDDFSISTVHGKFDPTFLWAHPWKRVFLFTATWHVHITRHLIMKQPRNALLTSSDATRRQLNDLRITVHPAHVCSAVAVNAGEAIQRLGPEQVMPHYKTKRSALEASA